MQGNVRWRFGPFEADLREQQLRRGHEVVPVTRKSFALLAALLGRPGQLVTKAELFDTVWAGTVVTDAALSRAVRELRVALGDDAAAPAYIATAHGLGFRFVAAVDRHDGPASRAPAGTALPAAAALRPAAPGCALEGRDDDLAALAQAMAGCLGGQRQAVFVCGEAGLGKTALAEAFAATQASRGTAWVAQGRCIEQYGTGEAYLPVLEALESLARQVGPERMREVLQRYAPAWLAQLPWLAHDADPDVLRRALEGTSSQRMLREIAQALEVLAAEHPVVLWLEDLHWSDYSTLDIISFLAGRREPARLLLLATHRPGEASAGAMPLARLVQGLVQRGQARERPLAPLDADAVARYLQRRLQPGAGLPMADLAAFVHRRTEGHALFMVALVDHLVHSGQLRRDAAGWALAAPVAQLGTAMPDSLRQLVQQQLAQLPADDLRLAEAAAVAGPEFCAAAVAAALEADLAGVEERCLRLALAGRLLRQGPAVAWPDGTESAGFAFRHALYWQGAYERIAPARRAEWHRRIAQRQEQAFGGQAAQIAAELAMRWEAARDATRSLHHLQVAGAAALGRCAYLEAADLLRHGLELVAALPADERARRELDLLLPLGAALMAVQGFASDEVDATYRRALEVGRVAATPRDLERALRGLWNVALVRCDLAQAQVLADELIVHAAARASRSAAFDAFAKQGQTLMHRGDFVAAGHHLDHALALPLPPDDATRMRESPRVAAYQAWVAWYLGRPDSALGRAQHALAAADAAGSPHSSAFALGFVAWLHLFRDEPAAARERALQQRALATEHGLAYWGAWSDVVLGLAAAREGDAPAGCRRAREGIDAFEAMGAQAGLSHFLTALAEAELAAGHPAEARTDLARAVALLQRNGNAYHAAETARLQGELARADGDLPAARRHLEAAAARAASQQVAAPALRALLALVRLDAEAGTRNAHALARLAALLQPGGEARALPEWALAQQVLTGVAEAGGGRA